jgi:PmbA protein
LKEEWTNLKNVVEDVLKQAKALGVDAAEAGIVYQSGLSVTVRLGETETIEFNRDKSLNITVYKGKKKGTVSTTDILPNALRTTLEAACRIATYTEEDECSGLADQENMANANDIPNLDLYHPWDIAPEQAIAWAKECEDTARAVDPKIVNSEGASFSTHSHFRIYGNTHGFIGAYPSTRHSLSCVVIGKSNDSMQRDYDYTQARDGRELESTEQIGRRAAERTLKRLNGRKIKTCEAPVIFAAEIASGLIANFIAAISGSQLYRKSSFLVDHLGKRIFPTFVHLEEVPHLLKGLGSAPFDQEGVATKRHDIVREGILQSYVLSSYSARKLGLKTTGNCGGIHNLMISSSEYGLPELIKNMNTGLLVTELLGQGVNLVTGDYSRGAAGFWVENGEIQYPVEEITIAGNLKQMFSNLVAVGNDIEKRSHILTGSLWIDQMTIAGA